MPAAAPLSRRSLIVAGAALAASRALPASAQSTPALHVMSLNLRFASPTPPHSWPERRPVLRRLLQAEAPHLIGTQEGLYEQLRDIESDLAPHYAWIGEGRLGGSRDEFMAVFYDTRRLKPLAYEHFWLSAEPDRIASASWGNEIVRMATWVRFQDRRTQREFYALNTHLDHRSQPSREHSAALIVRRLAELDGALPRIITGDFNVPAHGNPVYDTLLSSGLTDTWDTAAERGPLQGTHHGYRPPLKGGERIDWILTSRGVRCSSAQINTYAHEGQFPSDHLPVQAVLTLQ